MMLDVAIIKVSAGDARLHRESGFRLGKINGGDNHA